MEEVVECKVCKDKTAIYTCPRCNIKTCSLQCITVHKKETNCTGERDKTAYVPIKKFDNLTLLSDYRLLEDITRTVDVCRRNPQRRYTRFDKPLPTNLFRLKCAARKRNIQLQYLPQHFKRHAENETILYYDTQLIHWKLEFIFPQGEMVRASRVVEENTRLVQILDEFISPIKCPHEYKKFLRFYHAAGFSDVVALLKAERTKVKGFFIVDLFSTINEILKNRVIIEYPIIYIVRKSFIDEYNILSDDFESFEISKGDKTGFFGDFTPINFFKDLSVKKEVSNGSDTALNSIQESAATLRNKNIEEDIFYEEEYPKKYLNIPSYDVLCAK